MKKINLLAIPALTSLFLSSVSFAQNNLRVFDCQGQQNTFRLFVDGSDYSVASSAASSPILLQPMTAAEKVSMNLPVQNPFYYKGDNDIWIIKSRGAQYEIDKPLEADERTGKLGQRYVCSAVQP